jgi:predicted TIM-barrel fold metal-dependent hydrolase
MHFFSLKNFLKAFLFISVIGGFTYYVVGKIQYRQNIMSFEEYDPPSTLLVSENLVTRAKFPFVDIHNHQFDMPIRDLSDLTAEMDSLNMAFMVNLSGFRGMYLAKCLKNVKENAPNRFGLFVNLDWEKIDEANFAANNLEILRQAKRDGAIGLKVYKGLGLTDTDKDGKRIAVDDPRLDPIWAESGRLGFPVLIHSAEPPSFWLPKDKNNERWLELKQKPSRYRDPAKVPSFESIIAEQHHIFEKHPGTTFINAHLGWMGNDLDRLGAHLDRYPNVMTEIGAVLAELGRQPRSARQFLIDYQDRVLFGKDSYKVKEYYTYFRVLETEDEYFDYYRKRHAFWKMYGLGLPDDVLQKLYYKNALRILPSIDASLFPKE